MRGRVDSIVVKGKVFSGLGEGRKYISLRLYSSIFKELLRGKDPYPGTLNIRLIDLDVTKIIRVCKPSEVNDIQEGGKRYGGFLYWFAEIANNAQIGGGATRMCYNNAVAVRPYMTRHEINVIEIVSDKNLREFLNLSDGDIVLIRMKCR